MNGGGGNVLIDYSARKPLVVVFLSHVSRFRNKYDPLLFRDNYHELLMPR